MKTAAARFSALSAARSTVLENARTASRVTIPGLIPLEGQNEHYTPTQPYQSVGADGVRSLSARLLMTLFPTNVGFFRLTAAEQDSYNTLVDNQATARQGVEWLMSKFNAARPAEGSLIEAEASPASGDVFRSKAEMTSAIQDPRYKTDPAYRNDVAQKLWRSNAAGSLL